MEKGNITIKQLENGCFDVLYNEKRTGDLSFDEMLGLIAAITMPQKTPLFTLAQNRGMARRGSKALQTKGNRTREYAKAVTTHKG